jgi:hypothetical protein
MILRLRVVFYCAAAAAAIRAQASATSDILV